eukprot:TRINITY_DN19995_c0_g1_i1.p1 TRINITY_DN19995_c0_g1~~TRINITY_DN19995_c0_g1_i1.p1  ORF type:complete len:414 (+),score=68.39 TRINITY_DN19995_c0_g1_i1:109-1350(+)
MSYFPDAYIDFPETRRQTGLYGKKKATGTITVPDDDNYAYIEHLLDTLQSDDPPDVDSAPLTPHDNSPAYESSVDSELAAFNDVVSVAASKAEAGATASARTTAAAEADSENWNSLLQRFCQEGDESVVDVLLDTYLKSTRDAGNLIDAIDQGTILSPKVVAPKPSHPRLHLNLQQVNNKGMTYCSPVMSSLDALLTSARGLLHSARSAHSQGESLTGSPEFGPGAGPATFLASPRGSASTAPLEPDILGLPQEQIIERAPEVMHNGFVEDSEEKAAVAEGACQGETSVGPVPPTHPHPSCGSACAIATAPSPENDASYPVGPEGVPATRSEILSRLNEMEDPKAMRVFMKQFLIGVRRRLLNMDSEDGEGNDDAVEESDSDEESSRDPSDDDNQSVWTFRSVSSCSPSPSDN